MFVFENRRHIPLLREDAALHPIQGVYRQGAGAEGELLRVCLPRSSPKDVSEAERTEGMMEMSVNLVLTLPQLMGIRTITYSDSTGRVIPACLCLGTRVWSSRVEGSPRWVSGYHRF